VCSVQFKAVCDGLKAYHASNPSNTITIEGDTVDLDPTCGVFITMNPGYLGRSELPEGLKTLFRPITVVTPDLVLICENMLMAEGFQTAKTLAIKFYALYSLLSKLLSQQSHYDWGLRAVKSVLVVAGQFRRATPQLREDEVLLRALRDFNIPKIVNVDEVIFFGILKDLFPGIDPPRMVDEELAENVNLACEENGFIADPRFTAKVIQLDELIRIRHCVFIMGQAGCGKSSCWKLLRAAHNTSQPSKKVKVVDINPKVLPTEDLYGHINLVTREWKDGLLSRVMRDLGNIPNENYKWIVLDGDLDANWIESMNSVMDDNRMLTLACNERIPLKDHMRMLFEIRDLKYATPATVSRAGILYISTDEGSQWRCIVEKWIKFKELETADEGTYTSDSAADSDHHPSRSIWSDLFDRYLPDCLKFFSTLTGVVFFNEICLVTSLLNALDVFLPLLATNYKADDYVKTESAFVFCLLWGLGAVLGVADDGTDYQRLFSDWFRAKFKSIKIPMRDSIFDYWLDFKTMKFEPWKNCPLFKSIEFNSTTTSMHEVTIPTTQTVSLSFWMSNLVQGGRYVMVAGVSGSGKTQLVNGILKDLNPEFHSCYTINMNYFTTATVLQDRLDSCLQKRTGSTFGPAGSVNLVYFIDDLNLPEVDAYGTQSGLALLRQHVDYGHWYDRQKLTMKRIDNVQYVAALNPSAGSFQINPRLQRHFSTFAVTMPSVTSLHTIFFTYLTGHFASQSFKPAICNLAGNMIKAALGVHREISESFRKTATNFHYEFHVRHIFKIFEGLISSSPLIFKVTVACIVTARNYALLAL
jgi:dynein heavy chain, axonemal